MLGPGGQALWPSVAFPFPVVSLVLFPGSGGGPRVPCFLPGALPSPEPWPRAEHSPGLRAPLRTHPTSVFLLCHADISPWERRRRELAGINFQLFPAAVLAKRSCRFPSSLAFQSCPHWTRSPSLPQSGGTSQKEQSTYQGRDCDPPGPGTR